VTIPSADAKESPEKPDHKHQTTETHLAALTETPWAIYCQNYLDKSQEKLLSAGPANATNQNTFNSKSAGNLKGLEERMRPWAPQFSGLLELMQSKRILVDQVSWIEAHDYSEIDGCATELGGSQLRAGRLLRHIKSGL
jgi:hypothetical protein